MLIVLGIVSAVCSPVTVCWPQIKQVIGPVVGGDHASSLFIDAASTNSTNVATADVSAAAGVASSSASAAAKLAGGGSDWVTEVPGGAVYTLLMARAHDATAGITLILDLADWTSQELLPVQLSVTTRDARGVQRCRVETMVFTTTYSGR